MTRKQKIMTAVLLVLGLAWTAFIFSRSMQSGAESSIESGQLTAFLQSILGGIPVSEYFVRKLAHFGEYLILSLPVTGAAMLPRRRWLPAISWGYAVLVALCDEFVVQALSVDRGARFSDVLIDSAGALVGTVAVVLLFFLTRRYQARRDQ